MSWAIPKHYGWSGEDEGLGVIGLLIVFQIHIKKNENFFFSSVTIGRLTSFAVPKVRGVEAL